MHVLVDISTKLNFSSSSSTINDLISTFILHVCLDCLFVKLSFTIRQGPIVWHQLLLGVHLLLLYSTVCFPSLARSSIP